MDTTIKIVLLDLSKSNWKQWSTAFRGYCLNQGIKGILKGTELRPKGDSDDDIAKQKVWDTLNDKANGRILQTIVGSEGNFVDDSLCVKLNYEKLEERHLEKLPAVKKDQMDKIEKHLRKAPNQSIRVWYELFTIEIAKYEEIAEAIPTLKQCEYFLNSLEKDLKWQDFRHETCTDDTVFEKGVMIQNWLTMEHLYTMALKEERKLRDEPGGAEISQTTDSTKVKWDARRVCFNCGGLGHMSNLCSSGKRPPAHTITKASVKTNVGKSREKKPTKPSEAQQTDAEEWMTGSVSGKDGIYLDTLCTKVFVNDLKYFKNYTAYETPVYFGTASCSADVADPSRLIAGEGQVELRMESKTGVHIILMTAVYIPAGRNNLIPEGIFYEWFQGYSVVNTRTGKDIVFKGRIVGQIMRLPNLLYKFNQATFIDQSGEAQFVEVKSAVSAKLLHSRLGHVSYRRLNNMKSNGAAMGLYCSKIPSNSPFCTVCKVANSHSKPHQKYDDSKEYTIGALVVGDYKGPLNEPCLQNGVRGAFVIHDRGSGHTRLFLVTGKADQLQIFHEYRLWFENLTGKRIRSFRHDRGTEYTNTEFRNYLARNQIEDQTTAAYSPESNMAESVIRLIDRIAKAMIIHAGLGKQYYLLASQAACYTLNRLCSMTGHRTPHESLTHQKPRLDHIRVFGCKAIAHIPKKLRRSGDPSGRVCRFVGYGSNSLTYKLFDGVNFTFVESRDVDFDESCFQFSYSDIHNSKNDPVDSSIWFVLSNDMEGDTNEETPAVHVPSDHHDEGPAVNSSNSDYIPSESSEDEFHDTTTGPPDEDDSVEHTSESSSPSSVPRSLESSLGPAWSAPTHPRRHAPPLTEDEIRATLAEHEEFTCLQTDGELFTKKIPKNYWEVKGQPNWMTAIQKELQSLTDHGSWEVVPLFEVPAGSQVLDTTWVFSLKEDPILGEFEKARLCVRGDQENTDPDAFEEFFAGVARIENFKMLLILAISENWEIVLIDVKNAFVNAKLKKPVYVKIPMGMEKHNRKTMCLLLLKALYGLRGAPAAWNEDLSESLKGMGFTKCKSDWNLYFRRDTNSVTLLAYHVDDGLFVCSSNAVLNQLIELMKKKYTLKIMFNPSTILGSNVDYDREKCRLYLNQSKYIVEAAKRFKVQDTRPYSTPMEPGFVASITSQDTPAPAQAPYRALLGTLLHVGRMTRSDVMYSVNPLTPVGLFSGRKNVQPFYDRLQ